MYSQVFLTGGMDCKPTVNSDKICPPNCKLFLRNLLQPPKNPRNSLPPR